MALIVKSTRERVVKLFIVTLLCLGFAAWCWYDAKYKYIGEDKASKRRFNKGAVPVLIVLGALALFSAVKAAKLRIEADEQTGITVNSRAPIAWDAIEDIDTSALAKKGYLYLKYRKSADELATLKLDEYNLDFFDELYAMILAKLGLPQQADTQSEPSSSNPLADSQKPPT